MRSYDGLRVWVATVDMGLGHQRATYPFSAIAEEGILSVNNGSFVSGDEKKLWDRLRSAYEFLSRARSLPLIGRPLFSLVDSLQYIHPFYPVRDMSQPSSQTRMLARVIRKGLCRGMMEKISAKPLPLLTSYMTPAIAADMHGYEQVYCIICDAEINRAWVAEDPSRSRIRYFAPCGRATRRLRSYGVPEQHIFTTGFPLPLELLGGRDLPVLKRDLAQRLHYLDPGGRFWPVHRRSVHHYLGKKNCTFSGERVFTLTFAVGGAGAQTEYAGKIVRSLRGKLQSGEMRLNLVAGVRGEVVRLFQSIKEELLPGCDNLQIVHAPAKEAYFRRFSQAIRETDVLWTKPSELSFYCGLGIPLIISPALGWQEVYNRKWLLEVQAGIVQEDPPYADQWLFDLLEDGRLAESAWDGFIKARKCGTYKIMDVLATGGMDEDPSPLKR
ncbi:MAG: hypothetical protein ACOC8N_01605 [Spirochaetota bacterium]